jgi:hypothetical protein
MTKLFKDLTIAEHFQNAGGAALFYYKECTDPNFPGRDEFPIGSLETKPAALRYRVQAVQQHLDRILEIAKEIEDGQHNTTTN